MQLKITYANKCLVLYGTAVIKICFFILEIKVRCTFFFMLIVTFFFLRKKCETQFSPRYLFVDPATSRCN